MTDTLFSIARAMSAFLASTTTSAFSRGRPLLVGTNSAVAPWEVMILAGSGSLESLQITIPKVRPPTLKTGIRSPA
jgi:hypothetical protein